MLGWVRKFIDDFKAEWRWLHPLPNRYRKFWEEEVSYHEDADYNALPTSPVVSVAMVTYNHEQWIASSLDSVVMQETNFPFEIVLGEDCSTDTTFEICKEYQRRYPDKIRLIHYDRNVGPERNIITVQKLCRGEYIADLEGDDYWTDKCKLQKQIDLIRKTGHEFSVAWYDNFNVHDNELRPEKYQVKEFVTPRDIINHYYHTSTYVYSRRLFERVKQYFYDIPSYDTVMSILLAHEANGAACFNAKVSIRRRTGVGIATSLEPIAFWRVGVIMYGCIFRYGPSKLRSFTRIGYENILFQLICQRLRERRFSPEILADGLMYLRIIQFPTSIFQIKQILLLFVYLIVGSWYDEIRKNRNKQG